MSRTKRLWSLSLIALLTSIVNASRTMQQHICTEDSFKPNYISQLTALIRWREFPVRVYFMRDENYTPKRQQLAVEGFQQWVQATDKKVQFVLVEEEAEGQLLVRFDPASKAGRTDCTFYPERREIVRAEMVIGVQGDSPIDIQNVAVHEFGHALGIVGHSTRQDDVMYPRYTVGVQAHISANDLNVIKTAYCELFEGGQVLASLERTRGLPSSRDEPRKVRIVCEKPRSVSDK
ncbi:hypothetical protein HRbin15_00170 [bacterium HR15]|nr:hypothetical protein HRbin15_00170 [bacterium HR15]